MKTFVFIFYIEENANNDSFNYSEKLIFLYQECERVELGHQELEDLVVGVEERLLLLLPQANYPHQVLLSSIFSRRGGGDFRKLILQTYNLLGLQKEAKSKKNLCSWQKLHLFFWFSAHFQGAEVILEVK